jgi:micrococcal nuclease
MEKRMATEPYYIYKAIIRSIYDGDTITVDIDVGFGDWKTKRQLRLYGIDAPELRGVERPEGLKARDWIRSQLPVGTEFILETVKAKDGSDSTEKYGRYLAVIYKDGVNMNLAMIEAGHAIPYMVD